MDVSVERLHHLLMEFVRAVEVVQQAVPGQPMTFSQMFALHELDTDPPLSQRDLAERLRLEKSSVSRLAADLEQKGLLVRERDPANRRFYRLRLTARGRGRHASMATAFHERFMGLVEGMTAAERTALVAGMTAFVRAMHERAPHHLVRSPTEQAAR